ncbi:hypothetical protein [Prosthecodimorpha staleyi]|uniref:Uncharacterized protein n=1 Tax=Prosthecodimorpha staleyi TaxID=2840188 RepID=A0A947D7Q6_9HYPH|nr:hypothetical protein [Prosthecodimorpha staleyi]MBT9292633.1 hypothetical protein [Prosthecodimorpha staleyi]
MQNSAVASLDDRSRIAIESYSKEADVLTEQIELAMSRQRAEAIIATQQKPINRNLIRLAVVTAPETYRRRWTAETLEWIREIAQIFNKKSKRPFPSRFYFRLLFMEPFGGADVDEIHEIIESILDEVALLSLPSYGRAGITEAEVLAHLEEFHFKLSEAISNGSFIATLSDPFFSNRPRR